MRNNKIFSVLIITLIYILTIGGGVGLYFLLPLAKDNSTSLMLTMLIIDLCCTIVIFIFSLIFKNASIYDPYWSVAPAIILPAYMLILGQGKNIYAWLVIVCVWIWSIRLTINWLINFKNLNSEDWRYQMLRAKKPKIYFLTNLFGIHLFPTCMVFIGMLPAFLFIGQMANSQSPTGALVIALIVMLFGVVIETIADIQMFKFRKTNQQPYEIMNKGLWRVSRHPNYFGEILFWCGLYLTYASLFSGDFGNQFALLLGTAASPILIFVMFVFISIPMLEKRMKQTKLDYQEYINTTNMLLIFPARTPIKKK